MNIDNLRESISSLSDEDLMLVLKDIRSSRRVSKKEPKKVNVKSKESSIDISTLLGSMSPEQIKELLNKLETQGG